MAAPAVPGLVDGATCKVVAGTHAGKAGVVRDIHTSKTGHVTITDRVHISGHTSITKSIDQPGVYSGVYPFEPNREWRRNAAQVRHLAEIARRLAALEEGLAELKGSRS